MSPVGSHQFWGMTRSSLILALVFTAACRSQPTTQPVPEAPISLPSTTTSTPGAHHDTHEAPAGLAAATLPLAPKRRAALGLPPAGEGVIGAELGPLATEQWTDPEVVAGRFLLVQTNHAADEEPTAVASRRATYTSARLAEDLALSAAGAVPLEELREADTVFYGEVVGLALDERSPTTATVAASVRRWHTSTRPATPARISFYVLRLVLDQPNQRWLVVDVEVT